MAKGNDNDDNNDEQQDNDDDNDNMTITIAMAKSISKKTRIILTRQWLKPGEFLEFHVLARFPFVGRHGVIKYIKSSPWGGKRTLRKNSPRNFSSYVFERPNVKCLPFNCFKKGFVLISETIRFTVHAPSGGFESARRRLKRLSES